jgi:hypothetical protein
MASNTGKDADALKSIKLGIHICASIALTLSSSLSSSSLSADEIGVGVQEFFIIIFTTLALLFQKRLRAVPDNYRPYAWKPLLFALYAALALITARIIFRLVEFTAGFDGPIPRTEWPYYVFDAVPMLLASIVFNIAHPGRYLVGPESEFPKKLKKGKKGKKGIAEGSESSGEQVAPTNIEMGPQHTVDTV